MHSAQTHRNTQTFVARSYAALFGLGGVLVLTTLMLSHPRDRHPAWMAVPATSALLLSASLLLFGRRMPGRSFPLLPLYGSLCVASVSYGAGAELRVTYATFFFWSVISAFYFFPRRAAIPNVPFAAVLYALVLLAGHESFFATRYLVTVAAVTVSVILIDQLNVQRDRLAHELESTLHALEEQARTDPVTGLPNRREFARHLSREVARAQRGGLSLSVLMIDLDRFKRFNDTYGHPAGDRLLQAVVRAWHTRLRTGDVLVRYGGDEFAVILPDCQIEDAEHLAERLRGPLPEGQTCSIGVAAWGANESGEHLVSRADEALLMAKRHGRDGTRLSRRSTRWPEAEFRSLQ